MLPRPADFPIPINWEHPRKAEDFARLRITYPEISRSYVDAGKDGADATRGRRLRRVRRSATS